MPLRTFDLRSVNFEIEDGVNKIKIGNILIQWGDIVSSNTALTNVAFDEAYTQAPHVYLTMSSIARGADLRTPQVSSTSTTGFAFFVSAGNANTNYYSGASTNWLAIGVKDD